jgi:hypothetical protein
MAHHARPRRLVPSLVLIAMTGVTGACASILGYDGGELATDGGIDAPLSGPDGGCVPTSCPQNSCATVDSCGHSVQCSCPNLLDGCDAGTCTGCTWSCEQANATCGSPTNICSDDGGLLNCGQCLPDQACNAFNCGTGPCTPLTCADFPDGSCGSSFQTGCDGGTIACNNCPTGTTCTGSSCCELYTCAANYPGQCGSALGNNCGGTLDCSNNCAAGQDCSNQTCCTPATSCPPGSCGNYTDPCSGMSLPCPPCDGGCEPNSCPAGLCPSSFDAGCGQTLNCLLNCGLGVCDAGSCCTPATCSSHCGTFTDPCTGNVLNCPPCDGGADADAGCSPANCSGGNACVGGVCEPLPSGCMNLESEMCMGTGGAPVQCSCGSEALPCLLLSSPCQSDAGTLVYCCK